VKARTGARTAEVTLLAAIHAFAVARSPRLAFAPAGPTSPSASATPGTGLRANGTALGGRGEDGPSWLIRVDPRDGAVCVFRDALVVAHFSRAVDATSVTAQTFRVWDDQGPIPGAFRLSPDACVLIWEARRPLEPHVHHFVTASRLRDVSGREVSSHQSRFLTCDLMRHDISG